MSYSFSFTAANKAEAKQKAEAELDRVVQQQPVHRNDQKQALAAVCSFVDLMPEPSDGQEVNVSVSGSVSWTGTSSADGSADISGAGLHITVSTTQAPRR